MNKAHFIDAVAAKAGLSKKDARAAIEASLETITETLASGENVAFIGFGTFSTSARAARIATVPSTGAKVNVPATTIAKFKIGKILKEAVAK